MGNVLKFLDLGFCDNCSKYVCNAMTFHSDCLDCCHVDLVTNEVEVGDGGSEYSVEVENCLSMHKK